MNRELRKALRAMKLALRRPRKGKTTAIEYLELFKAVSLGVFFGGQGILTMQLIRLILDSFYRWSQLTIAGMLLALAGLLFIIWIKEAEGILRQKLSTKRRE